MICHRTIGPSVCYPGGEGHDGTWWHETAPTPRDCLGSVCSAWDPVRDGLPEGRCREVRTSRTWPDPAAKEWEK